MLFYLTSRIVGTATAFLYPAYSSYKTLSQRPASEAELERWLMYWSVLGALLSLELFAEWTISWIPFYYTVKTVFLLYLSLPQTQGSTFIYINYLSPLLHEHEDQIDRSMTKVRGIVWEFVQTKARAVWDALVASLGQQPGVPAMAPPPPTQNDPASGPAQMAMGLWRTYGPMVLTTGAAIVKQYAPGATGGAPQSDSPTQGGQQRTASFFAERPPAQPYPGSSSRVSSATTHSILERRRALEAELAALDRIDPSAGGSDVSTPSSSPFTSPDVPNFPIPSIYMGAASSGSTSSSTSPGSSPHLRTRTASGVGLGRFEEIEMPPEGYDVGSSEGVGHSYDNRPGQPGQRRTSWFGWGSSAPANEGYERVKDD
ncbi:hypothetical protein V5O48_003656 [Marasmius crinis-equi]|uniref:Protein YOP1 n=1 Tax=Marasmius crinis-equi TaxID=585013 RepID=A0ABR3FSA7_9AGAR